MNIMNESKEITIVIITIAENCFAEFDDFYLHMSVIRILLPQVFNANGKDRCIENRSMNARDVIEQALQDQLLTESNARNACIFRDISYFLNCSNKCVAL